MTYKHLQRARKEGRLCKRCKWFVSKKRWKQGKRLCEPCEDALRGLDVPLGGYKQPQQEPIDKTGDMI